MNLHKLKPLKEKRTFKKLNFCLFFLMLPLFNFAQSVITGEVRDEKNVPLEGVSIVIKDTKKGVTTNNSGQFQINATKNDVLVFSFTGFNAQEIVVGDNKNISVVLRPFSNALEEVVLVGYGTQKKANLTGAVGFASSERLEERPIVDAGQGLQGVIPNLNVSIRNGDPTTPAQFNIRGFTSINGGGPLILVDGVPMDLELINPDDIASISVLKDASAAAIYGARAAFGVILVETKKGKASDKINIAFNTELAIAKPIFLMDPVTDPYLFVTNWNAASIRTTGQPSYDDDYVQGTKAWTENPTFENAWKVYNGGIRFYGYNDYQHRMITKVAPQQKYDLSLSGGSDKVKYYASFGYLNKDGYLKPANNENFKRYNILMKADIKVNKWLELDEKFTYNTQLSNKPHFYNWDVNINSTARQSPIALIQFPDLPFYLTQGDHDQFAQYIGMYFGGTNFFPYLLNGGRTTFNRNDIWLTQGATLSPVKGLKIRGDFSYNQFTNFYQDVASQVDVVSSSLTSTPMTNHGYSEDDFINNRDDHNQYYVFNAYADYTLDQFENHFLKLMVGYNQEWGKNTYIMAQAKKLITSSITDLNATTGNQQTGGGKSQLALQGVFYRLNYSFKDKYLFEADGRYDGTSRFPKHDRFGFFPSFSAAWRISKESFMDNASNWLNDLKLRASYGTLGNQLLSDFYPYIPTMGTGSAPYIMTSGLIPYVSPAGLVSPSLTWETVVGKNLGLDFTMLGQRLDVSVDVYQRDTKDMLMNVHLPDILGTNAPKSNAANLRTKGWEISATWRDRINTNWKYDVTLALSDNTSKITKYENPNGAIDDYYVGKSIGEIWAYKTAGIFQSDEEASGAPDQSQLGANWRAGDIQYADLNHDGKITPGNRTLTNHGDLIIVGNTTPRYSFGVNTNVSFKNLSLNVFFQGLLKRDYLPNNGNWNAFYPFNDGHMENYFITESWSETNRDAYFAAPTIGTNTKKNIQPQSRYVQNAAYIRLKNLTLNYSFPAKWIENVKMITRVQLYFAGMNLWEYSKMHKPLDPESVTTVTQEYYLQRIYTLGLKVNF